MILFEWVVAIVWGIIFCALNNIWYMCFGRRYTYRRGRKFRSTRTWILFRCIMFLVPPCYMFGRFFEADFYPCLTGAVYGATALIVFGWTCVWLIFLFTDSGDPKFWARVRDGYDPFFDHALVYPLNTDPDEVKFGGIPNDIGPHNFTPPSNWMIPCPDCNAPNPDLTFWCWNCHNGWRGNMRMFHCVSCNYLLWEVVPNTVQQHGIICCGCGMAQIMGPDGRMWQMRTEVASRETPNSTDPPPPANLPDPSHVPAGIRMP